VVLLREDRALLCSGLAETDRFGRSGGQTVGRETPRKQFPVIFREMSAPMAKARPENRRGLARRAVSKRKGGPSQIREVKLTQVNAPGRIRQIKLGKSNSGKSNSTSQAHR
jgi:hypothetical protein